MKKYVKRCHSMSAIQRNQEMHDYFKSMFVSLDSKFRPEPNFNSNKKSLGYINN